jgi:hypothetical protein
MASINSFSNTAVNVLSKGFKQTDPRPRIPITIDGVTLEVLFDTGAQVNCLTSNTFNRFLPHLAKLGRQPNPGRVNGAGNNQLGLNAIHKWPVTCNGKVTLQEFWICENLDDNIVGIPFMNAFGLAYNAVERRVMNVSHMAPKTLTLANDLVIEPHQTRVVRAYVHGDVPAFATTIATIGNPDHPLLFGGPALTDVDNYNFCTIAITNAGPQQVVMARNYPIGTIEHLDDHNKLIPLTGETVDHLLHVITDHSKSRPLSDKEIADRVNLDDVPAEFRSRYLQVIYKHRKVISASKNDLGRSQRYNHRIHLKDLDPVYVKQFPLKPDHQSFIEATLESWLKLGVVRRTKSLYNSPIFCVPKKTGQGLRIVQDFRALNTKTKIDKYSMKDISECIGDIGRAGSTIFTTIDLTSGFWQMPLHPQDSHLTAFTVKGKGQFEWVTSPMGLLGCPASFQRLMEHVLDGVQNILIYIDDVIIHTASHEQHLNVLDQTLAKLERHGLKINLDKCYFGNRQVAYLGFTLTPTGIEPGKEKLKLVKEHKEPTTLREVRAFVGLCNFFRNHIKNFALLSSPLTKLCRNDSGYENGALPEEAQRAFKLLQQALGSGPSLAFPRRNRKYVLVTEAYLPTEDNEGGLSATLCQLDQQGTYHILSHGSRQLLAHEQRYPHFLLEMLAALYGMEYFDEHLRGYTFHLLMDERPVEELSHLHKKTLARFRAAMENYQFLLQQKSSSNLPLELRTASAYTINTLGPRLHRLRDLQLQDQDLQDCLHFRQHQTWPESLPKDKADLLRGLNSSMFVDEEGLMWVRCNGSTAAFIPAVLRVPITCQLIRLHPQLTEPQQLLKKLIESSYIWPGASRDIKNHLDNCQDCILARKQPKPKLCNPNQRVVMHTFGPLPSYKDGKFIIIIRDEATGYTEFCSAKDRNPDTLANVLIQNWIAKLSLPRTLVTGLSAKENQDLRNHLHELLQIESGHVIMETANSHKLPNDLVDQLHALVQETELSWEDFIPVLSFLHNTSYDSQVQHIPFKLLHGYEPENQITVKSNYSESESNKEMQIYQRVKRLLSKPTVPNNAEPHPDSTNEFQLGQEVYFWEKSFGELKWKGPYPIIKVLPHKLRLQISPKTAKWFYYDRISPTPNFTKEGEGTLQHAQDTGPGNPQAQQAQTDISSSLNQLIQDQLDKTQALKKLIALNQPANSSALISALLGSNQSNQSSALINANQPAHQASLNETVEYLRDLSDRVYNSPLGDVSAFAPGELDYWNSFAPWERNILLTGDPLHPPEWRRNLIAFGDPEDYLPPPEAPPEPIQPLPTGSGSTVRNSDPIVTPPIPVDLNNNPEPVKKKSKGFASSFRKSVRKSYKGLKKATDPSTWYSALGEPFGPSMG